MNIDYLRDHRPEIPKLAAWYISEWPPYYAAAGPGDAHADLMSRCNRNTLPVGLVAVEQHKVLATAALGLDVSTNLEPSIIGLLVGPQFRRQGLAAALIAACEDLAQKLGHRQIYVSTSVLGQTLQRHGWHPAGDVKFLNAEHGSIYRKLLQP